MSQRLEAGHGRSWVSTLDLVFAQKFQQDRVARKIFKQSLMKGERIRIAVLVIGRGGVVESLLLVRIQPGDQVLGCFQLRGR